MSNIKGLRSCFFCKSQWGQNTLPKMAKRAEINWNGTLCLGQVHFKFCVKFVRFPQRGKRPSLFCSLFFSLKSNPIKNSPSSNCASRENSARRSRGIFKKLFLIRTRKFIRLRQVFFLTNGSSDFNLARLPYLPALPSG